MKMEYGNIFCVLVAKFHIATNTPVQIVSEKIRAFVINNYKTKLL